MNIRFRIDVNGNGEFFWNMLSGSNSVATSSSTFTRRRDAVRSINRACNTLGVNSNRVDIQDS